MKKITKMVISSVLATVLMTACSQSSQNGQSDVKHIGILQYVEHPSLTATRKGFIKELAKEGYKDGKNIKIEYKNAQGDQSNIQSISEKLIKDNKLVLGIATPAAQSLTTVSTETPILFTAVTDPVSAELVKSMKKPEGLATGTSDMSPIKKQVSLLRKVMPKAKRVGIMYTTSERNSEVQVKQAKKIFQEAGIKTSVKGIIASSVTLLGNLSKELKVPVVGGSADMVPSGLLFSYGADYEALGRQTARQAVKILKGKDVAKVPSEYPQNLKVVVNEDMAKELGIDVSSIKNNK